MDKTEYELMELKAKIYDLERELAEVKSVVTINSFDIAAIRGESLKVNSTSIKDKL